MSAIVITTYLMHLLQDELESVKGSKDSLELCLREKERNEHVYVNEVSELKKEIRRLIRNSSRESANLEYLKNIMLRLQYSYFSVHALYCVKR